MVFGCYLYEHTGNKKVQAGNDQEKVQVGKDQEKAQSEKKIPTPKTEVGKTKLTIRYLYHENIS